MKPLAIVLYAGLHGWEEGLVAEGWRCVGFDILDMCALLGQPRPRNCQLVLQDVLTLHGSQFRDADLIVASPPCQAYSYRAMPWSRAKVLLPSNSFRRRAASAMLAKIPFPLAQHIARCFYPQKAERQFA